MSVIKIILKGLVRAIVAANIEQPVTSAIIEILILLNYKDIVSIAVLVVFIAYCLMRGNDKHLNMIVRDIKEHQKKANSLEIQEAARKDS